MADTVQGHVMQPVELVLEEQERQNVAPVALRTVG